MFLTSVCVSVVSRMGHQFNRSAALGPCDNHQAFVLSLPVCRSCRGAAYWAGPEVWTGRQRGPGSSETCTDLQPDLCFMTVDWELCWVNSWLLMGCLGGRKAGWLWFLFYLDSIIHEGDYFSACFIVFLWVLFLGKAPSSTVFSSAPLSLLRGGSCRTVNKMFTCV